MGKPAVSLRNKLLSLFAVCLLACGLLPVASAFADEAATPMLASSLLDGSIAIVSEDVMLAPVDVDSDDANVVIEPVIGSFTVDGLTFALSDDGVTLVSVSPDAMRASGPDGGRGEVAPEGTSFASEPSEPSAPSGRLAIPSNVSYDGVTYDVTTIGPYAFYLSGATQVALPTSIMSVDDRAFRSSDVERVEVASDNPNIASFDGALYSADLNSLLLIPEGRAGAVLLPCETEVAEPSKFSHCSLVDAIDVEEGGAAFASWDGLLYDASGQTLLRVPAGATEITIREGCTTIAAGAMEGCAKLERINAPSTVTSISPDVFESVPTISLPAVALQDESVAAPLVDAEFVTADNPVEVEEPFQHLTAIVALLRDNDLASSTNPATITVTVRNDFDSGVWERSGFMVAESEPVAQAQVASTANAVMYTAQVHPNGHTLKRRHVELTRPNVSTEKWTATDLSSPELMEEPSSYQVVHWHAANGQFEAVLSWEPLKATEFEFTNATQGWKLLGFATSPTASSPLPNQWGSYGNIEAYAVWEPCRFRVSFDANGGTGTMDNQDYVYDQEEPLSTNAFERDKHVFSGWSTSASGPVLYGDGQPVSNLTATDGAAVILYAQWERVKFDLSFNVDSEPGDEDYPPHPKEDETVNIADGQVEIEDPKRSGYVFQGWVIPNSEGTEAIDQDLVYQGDDGKWYVDASKLPDYATDGKVELTARWTSIISVDVPSAVTFYADTVTQGQESREGAASSAFGQSKVANQSQVDLRVVGLESSAVETSDTMLGAASILKKATAATPATSAQKLLSLYPSAKAWTAEELKDPSAVGGDKATTAVDFDLDDLLLEASFSADDFTIPVGETLNMGYRLNLTETGQELDYDKLATLEDGQSAAIANISYCFSADPLPSDWGEPLWIENPDQSTNPAKYLLLDDIKEAANDLSANGENSEYYALYKSLLDAQVTNNGNPGVGPYFKVNINGTYWDLQLIGICQDTKSDGSGKAGFTFQLRDIYSYGNRVCYPGSGSYPTNMNSSPVNTGGWLSSYQRTQLRTTFYGYLDARLQSSIAHVDKYQQPTSGTTVSALQKTSDETIWLPSLYEVFGTVFSPFNESEGAAAGYVPFQYDAYQGNSGSVTNVHAVKRSYIDKATSSPDVWWLRSAYRGYGASFCDVDTAGARSQGYANNAIGIAPAFCL